MGNKLGAVFMEGNLAMGKDKLKTVYIHKELFRDVYKNLWGEAFKMVEE